MLFLFSLCCGVCRRLLLTVGERRCRCPTRCVLGAVVQRFARDVGCRDVVGRLFVARLEVLVVHRARGVDSRDWPKPRRGG